MAVENSTKLKMIIFFFLGKQNKLRVYYLSWLKAKIVKGEEVRSVTIFIIKFNDYFRRDFSVFRKYALFQLQGVGHLMNCTSQFTDSRFKSQCFDSGLVSFLLCAYTRNPQSRSISSGWKFAHYQFAWYQILLFHLPTDAAPKFLSKLTFHS